MKENFEKALAAVLHHEGGFVNHPADPGGMTNLGCTKKVWEEWVGRPVTEAEMRALKPSDVGPLYKARYWDKVRGDDLPAGVDYAVFDCAINSGTGRAAKFLQEIVGATADGAIGPGTLRAVAAVPPAEIVEKFNARRLSFLQALPTWATFGKGWGRRVNDVASVSTSMVADPNANLA
jgi:lysozyme family protein